jgi:hypothetical protein
VRWKVFASMADSTPRPADVPVDRLSVVREWLWRHSSQPNGDPWDGDPEHLDRAAQHLLDDLVHQLIRADPPIRAADRDAGLGWNRRDATASAPALSVSHGHPRRARPLAKGA